MVQLVNVLGCKNTRTSTCVIPCPVCHKKRQARRTWRFVDRRIIVVCPDCYDTYEDEEIFDICNKQGWITVCYNWSMYDYRTKFIKGITL